MVISLYSNVWNFFLKDNECAFFSAHKIDILVCLLVIVYYAYYVIISLTIQIIVLSSFDVYIIDSYW